MTAAEIDACGLKSKLVATDTRTLRHYYRFLPDNRVQIGSRSAITGADAGNAKHAQEFANCTKAETIALHKKNAAEAAAIVRGLSDAELDNKGVVLQGMPPMSVGDLAGGLMCGHIDEHLNSIRTAVGQ